MVYDIEEKNRFKQKFGRLIEDNEIVIEDVSESDILNIAGKMSKEGYNLEYWKAPKQESGHLHIKNIVFPIDKEITGIQKRAYKKKIMEKYINPELWKQVDWNFVNQKNHRIATEKEEHYKGYGIKSFIKSWNEEKVNSCEINILKEVFEMDLIENVRVVGIEDYENLINKIIPHWIKGNRQNICLSFVGYLRKSKRLGIDKTKAIIQEIVNRTKDEEVNVRMSAVTETYKKDESNVVGYSNLKDILREQKITPVITDELTVRTYEDYKKLKKNKNYIVEDFLFPGSVTMVYSPPAQFKSLLLQYLALCVSNGKDWLNFKTKKQPVLYLDGENSDQIIKERLEQIHKGMKLRRNKFPFYVIKGGEMITQRKEVNLGFIVALERVIEERGIKVLIFDTLHRFAYYDENKSDDINLLYTKVFQPLVKEYGVSIIFLHHSKKDGGYRGSGDFLGSVDVAYKISRSGKTNKFIIVNEKCRSGEISNINGEIDFGEDFINFYRRDEQQEEDNKIKRLKEVTERINNLLKPGTEMRRKEIIEMLEMEKFDYGDIKSITRSLKFLVDSGKFDKTGYGVYRRML